MTNAAPRWRTILCKLSIVALVFGVLGTAGVARHYHDQWYQHTPSIPFEPFCIPRAEQKANRPIRNATMTPKFKLKVIDALMRQNITARIHNQLYINDGIQILVTPYDFDGGWMLSVTQDAFYESQGYTWAQGGGKDADIFGEHPLDCKNIEKDGPIVF